MSKRRYIFLWLQLYDIIRSMRGRSNTNAKATYHLRLIIDSEILLFFMKQIEFEKHRSRFYLRMKITSGKMHFFLMQENTCRVSVVDMKKGR